MKKIVSILICLLLIITILPIAGSRNESQADEEGLDTRFDTDWWPMFHHDLNNTGYSTSPAPDTNNVRWSRNINCWVSLSPAIVDGKVYVGGRNSALHRGELYCLDASTGAIIWSNTDTIEGQVEVSPAIAYGNVYIGGGSLDTGFYCLNAENGNLIWNNQVYGAVYSDPAVVEGKVYFGSLGGRFYCLDAYTGEEIWNYTADDIIDSSPAVADGKVYFGSHDKNVYCLDAETGDSEWTYTASSYVMGSPTLANGKVYIGTFGTNGIFYCLDANTGEEIWTSSEIGGIYAPASGAIAYGNIYIGSMTHKKVYCLNAENGEQIWNFTADGGSYPHDGRIRSSPAVADGKVYVGSYDHKIYCVDAYTGALIWKYTTDYWVISSPSVANGYVYVGSIDENLYCFGEPIENYPPYTPSEPNPEDGAIDVDINIDLSWIGGDPDTYDTVTYDVYFGEVNPPPQVEWNQTETIFDPGTLEYVTIYYWQIVSWDNHGAFAEGPLWEFTTEESLESDLDCDGSLSWDDVEPGSILTDYFTVENIGNPGSELDWEIIDWPEWGSWAFIPSSGDDLTPEQGPVTVGVQVVAPDEENTEFEGEVKIINSGNPDDICTIPVSLITPCESLFVQFLEFLMQRFPLIGQILELMYSY
jgi:outer membrane protein assembly factor BamB